MLKYNVMCYCSNVVLKVVRVKRWINKMENFSVCIVIIERLRLGIMFILNSKCCLFFVVCMVIGGRCIFFK